MANFVPFILEHPVHAYSSFGSCLFRCMSEKKERVIARDKVVRYMQD